MNNAIEEFMNLRDQGFWSFRGQRKKEWNLGLHDLPTDSSKLEISMMQFKKRCMEFPKQDYIEEYDEWRWLFFAQHYRLKTRLLDWTSNPLVALYFAVENIFSKADDENDYGAVWAVTVPEKFFKSPDQIGKVSNVKEWIIVNPPPVTNRLARQSGKFSYHPPEEKEHNLELLVRRRGEELVKFEIDTTNGRNPTSEIRKQLEIMNVHHASLFPDPEGIAEFINHEWPIIGLKTKFEE